jgi:tetratricopeptide (TPR) repeat protein
VTTFIAVLLALAAHGAREAAVLGTAAAHIEKREYAPAIELLTKWMDERPDASPQVFVLLADCFTGSGRADAAARIIDRGLEKHPRSAPLLKARGGALLQDRRRSATAGEPLRKAVEVAPKDAEAHYLYSQWACLHNQQELCIREAEAALGLEPRNAIAALQLKTLIGVAADKLDRPAQAEAAFRQALEINRKMGLPDPVAAHRFVDFLAQRGREDEAQPVVDLLLAHSPRFGPAYLERAKYLNGKGETQKAIDLAERALDLEGMDREKLRAAHLLLARAWFRLGREEQAARHQTWIEQNPH